jgi:hypothetical protein
MTKRIILFVIALISFSYGQEISDPLTNGATVGIQNGGTFSSKGWTTQDNFSFIEYHIPTCESGSVEFDVTGIYASNDVFKNCWIDKQRNLWCTDSTIDIHHQLFNQWDQDLDNSWWEQVINGIRMYHNPFKNVLHIYGYTDPSDQWKWKRFKLRLNVCAFDEGGYDTSAHAFEDPAMGPIEWTKDHIYHFKIAWGNGHEYLWLDGVLMKDWDYSSFGCEYHLDDHYMRIGSAYGAPKSGGFKCPVGITYSNFVFTRNTDTTPPYVVDAEPVKAEQDVAIDENILVNFSESMDEASTQDAFTISPNITGTFKWIGTSLYFDPSGTLSPYTLYTIRVSNTAKDKSNNLIRESFISTFMTKDSTPLIVGRYEQAEFFLLSSGSYSNPYTQTNLKGVFTNGSKTITVNGFWDGGHVFKVRMAPTEVGQWNYSIQSTDASLVKTGSFTCVESGKKGFITTSGYGFKYSNGEEWQFCGNTLWRGYTSLVPYGSKWKEVVNLSRAQGYTAIQSIVHSFINNNPFWANEGNQCFEGTEANYDKLNPDYFKWIDKRLDYAESQDIVPIMFFTWAQDWAMFSNQQFKNYLSYLVARYASRNVVWIVCGEFSEVAVDFPGRTTEEFNEWGNLVKQLDPYNHPLSLHPTGRSSSREFGNTAWMNFIGQQTPYIAADITRDREFGKPVCNLELRYNYAEDWGAGPNDETRSELWEVITSGGSYTNGFHTYYAQDKNGFDLTALPDEQRQDALVNKYAKKISLSKMNPQSTSNGRLLAGDNRYLAYSRNGGSVTFNVTESGLVVTWINPRTSEEIKQGVATVGSNTFTPPFTGDWTLWIAKEVVDLRPEPPMNVRIINE